MSDINDSDKQKIRDAVLIAIKHSRFSASIKLYNTPSESDIREIIDEYSLYYIEHYNCVIFVHFLNDSWLEIS